MIVVVDFGSQTAHLIARRIRELGISATFVEPENALKAAKEKDVKGIILSGGPSSVYEEGAPTIDPEIFDLKIPILGICYGFQLMAKLLGGEVVSGKKEYGPAQLQIKNNNSQMTKTLQKDPFTVWMSHGDEIIKLPNGFEAVGKSDHVPFAFAEDENKKLYGILFHPEVEHTENGMTVLENFTAICGSVKKHEEIDVNKLIQEIKEKVGDAYVVGAVSGGVDSTVAGVLTAKAIGKQFVPVYVDNGLMRQGTTEHVKKIFTHIGHVEPIVLEVEERMLEKLQGVSDPEEKRKIIGKYYIELFEVEMQKLVAQGLPVKFLLQGTIYSDVIESQGTKHSSKIKSHHNVGGLPDDMKLELLEPLRQFYKDEVRNIGKLLGLPDDFVHRQVFPGPGYGIRVRGEVTKERLEKVKQADAIVLEELGRANLLDTIYMSFAIMSGADSTAVKGDGRFFGEVIALRVVESKDVMTSKWARLPYDVLQKISSRIVNEVPEISRVVYDISTKPPATMEWE
jgi:GMP synthase (glutamine-hydrolysing)